jgi:2-phosphosulfolactate phosphatase
MKIHIDSLITGASRAKGAVVIIDVFRAFTTAALAFSRGVKKIYLVPDVTRAKALKDMGLADYCVGEVGGKKPLEFDIGNSPYEITKLDLKNKTLILSTRAGVVGVDSVETADVIMGASLVNAFATCKWLVNNKFQEITIVAMGWAGEIRSDEDELCAMYMRNILENRKTDHNSIKNIILASPHAAKFDDVNQPWYHYQDRDLALDIDSIDCPIVITSENGILVAIQGD